MQYKRRSACVLNLLDPRYKLITLQFQFYISFSFLGFVLQVDRTLLCGMDATVVYQVAVLRRAGPIGGAHCQVSVDVKVLVQTTHPRAATDTYPPIVQIRHHSRSDVFTPSGPRLADSYYSEIKCDPRAYLHPGKRTAVLAPGALQGTSAIIGTRLPSCGRKCNCK